MKPIARRTFLSGLGTAIALPMLEAMLPVGRTAFAAPSPLKFAAVYFSNGTLNRDAPGSTNNYWRCSVNSEDDWELSRVLQSLADLKAEGYIMPIHGLYNACHDDVEVVDGKTTPGVGHFTEATSFLTGSAQAWDWNNLSIVELMHPGRSIDWAMADKAAAETPGGFKIPVLNMGTYSIETYASGSKGSKYLLNHVSWKSQIEQAYRHATSQSVFDELFGNSDPLETEEAAARRRRLQKSVLDYVKDDADAVRSRLGASDRHRMDEFLTGLRDLEQRIDQEGSCTIEPDTSTYADESYTQRAENMADLMVIAFQCGATRVSTFMLDTAHQDTPLSQTVGGNISGGHHSVSHYLMNGTREQAVAINQWQVARFGYLLRKLRDTVDIEGKPLLDTSMLMYGCGLGDGDGHHRADIAMVLAGKGGSLPAGKCKVFSGNPRHSNLLVALLQKWGIPETSWGNSNGVLDL